MDAYLVTYDGLQDLVVASSYCEAVRLWAEHHKVEVEPDAVERVEFENMIGPSQDAVEVH
jgi:hypothetical protein